VGVPVAVRRLNDPAPERAAEPAPAGTNAAGSVFARRSSGSHLSVIVVAVVGLLITAVLSVGARSLHNSNENRLLRQRVREAGAVVTSAIPSLQIPLSSAAVLAESTSGNVTLFRGLMTPLVKSGRPFTSASLWSLRSGALQPVVVSGCNPRSRVNRPPTSRS